MKSGILGVLAVTLPATLATGTELTSGKSYNQSSQFDRAIKALQIVIEREPGEWEAHVQIGYAYSMIDSVGLAYRHLARAKELNPKVAPEVDVWIGSNYAKHYKLGRSAFNRREYATAAHEFGVASLADPARADAWFHRAVVFAILAETDTTYARRALAHADRALELTEPGNAEHSLRAAVAGRQLITPGSENDAPVRFKRTQADRDLVLVSEEIGIMAMNREEWKAAVTLLEIRAAALEADGNGSFEVCYNAGLANYNLGRLAEAELVTASTADGCFANAIAHYEKALSLRPDDPQTILNTVSAAMARKDWANSSRWCEKYVTVSPEDPRGWQFLARIYNELGDKDKALDATKRYEQLRNQTTE